MMTVCEVSALAGVSVRTLHHYHQIGLLFPAKISEAGYRLYDDAALERLQHILLFRELGFSLKEIRGILDSSDFDRNKALDQQIALLQMKKEHLENLIALARGIKMTGVKNLDFTAFDTKKIDEYARQAKESWGHTPEFRQFEEKAKGRTKEQERKINVELMGILAKFGEMQQSDPAGSAAQEQVKKLQNFITEHFYDCSDEILFSLGKMYAGGGSMTENIDRAGGTGTAAFAARAIEAHCRRE